MPSPKMLLSLMGLAALVRSPFAAAYQVDTASFGADGRIAPEGHVAHWLFSGKDFTPEFKSDRIILTPPYPGNRQGAAWTEQRMNKPEFLVDFEFRTTGPDNGQGQLQMWYTKEGHFHIGTKTVYNVGRFTGLALLIDQAGGSRGGAIRAFLNDGGTDYASSNVEQLPFAHCDYSYRNLGRPSKLQLHQDAKGLEVLIDGRRCFRADDVFLPTDAYFGITASTGETPDSFEVFKFVTQTGISISREEPIKGDAMGGAPQQQQQQKVMAQPPPPKVGGTTDSPMLNDIHVHVVELGKYVPTGINEVKQQIGKLGDFHASKEDLRKLEAKIDRISQLVEKIAAEQKDWSGDFKEIHTELRAGANMFLDKIPESMTSALTTHGPNMLQIIFILIAAQLAMGLAYILYKRRQASPKKYL